MMQRKHRTIPVFIPELACPHRCVFCNQEKITSVLRPPTLEETQEIIEKHLLTISSEHDIDIGFLGGNFTGIDISLQKEYLSLAQGYLIQKKVSGIRISTRPDYINEEIVALLMQYGVTAVEIGLQSTDEEVLKRSGRGHAYKDVVRAASLINRSGIALGLQMMTGLPGDTLQKSIRTAEEICALGAKFTRIYPTVVVKDTPLEILWREGKYKPQSMEEAIKWVNALIPIFKKNSVDIIRIGLHPTEGFLDKSQLLDGPFHPAFSQLAEGERWYDKMLRGISLPKGAIHIEVTVNPGDIQYAIGHKGVNKKRLQEKFSSFAFLQSASISKGEFYVNYR